MNTSFENNKQNIIIQFVSVLIITNNYFLYIYIYTSFTDSKMIFSKPVTIWSLVPYRSGLSCKTWIILDKQSIRSLFTQTYLRERFHRTM